MILNSFDLSTRQNRRDFLKSASASTLIMALHPFSAFGCNNKKATSTNSPQPLLRGLYLHTTAPFTEMKHFYEELLGLKTVQESAEKLTIQAGLSQITFQKTTSAMGDPWYHIAFNIPEHKLLQARDWHLKRAPLILTPKHQRDAKYPKDVRHFPHWNAHSLFFWDPAGNLLEYIARHDLKSTATGTFTTKDILYASEIGFVVEDQSAIARQLHQDLGLEAYPKGVNFWWAMGDEQGLILCLPKGRVWGRKEDRTQTFDIYPTSAQIFGNQQQEYVFPNYPAYKILINAH